MQTRLSEKRIVLAVALMSLTGAIAFTPAVQAQVNFEGKRIVWIVPSAEGGGSDNLTRATSRFWTKYLPGNPQIVVRNIPGSGQVPGTNHFFQHAKSDGLMVITSSTSSLMNQALQNKAVKYDLSKTRTVMTVPQGNFAYANPDTTGVTKQGDVEALIKSGKKYRTGGYGPTSSDLRLLITWDLLGVKAQPLWGMGRSKTRQAFMRGETDISYDTASAYLKSVVPLVKKSKATMLFSLGVQRDDGTFVRDPVAPDLPHFLEVYQKIHGKKLSGPAYDAWYALFNIGVMTSKSINLAPNTPQPIVDAYITAARKMLQDPEFLKVKDELLGAYEVSLGKAGDKWVSNSVTINAETRKWLVNFLRTRYDVNMDGSRAGM